MRLILLTLASCLCLTFSASAQAPLADQQNLPVSVLSASVLQQAAAKWSIAMASVSGHDTVINQRYIVSSVNAAGNKVFQLVGSNKAKTLKVSSLLQRTASGLTLYASPAPEANIVICTGCGQSSTPKWTGNGWSCVPAPPNSGNCTKIEVAIED